MNTESGDDLSADAERRYNRIRAVLMDDVDVVAANTRLTVDEVRAIKQHLFFAEHELFDPELGKVTKRRFEAQEEIAFAWELAATRPLAGAEREWFQQLAAHELGELELIAQGLPFQDPRAWQVIDGQWEHVWSPDLVGAHELAPRPPKFAFPGYDAP